MPRDHHDEIALPRGDVTEGVVRVGDTVRRPRGAHSDAVAAYLLHLEAQRFDGAPRWLGVDERGRDILDFMPGEVPAAPPEPWSITEAVLAGTARLLRRLHDASVPFVPPAGSRWFSDEVTVEFPPGTPPPPPPELISHCDVTPQNTVFRAGTPYAVIDFDLAGPTSRLADLCNTAMHWVPLKDPRDREPVYADTDATRRLRVMVDAYGLTGRQRAELVPLAIGAAQRTWHRMRANAERRGGGWRRMWDEGVGDRIERRRRWLIENAAALTAAISED